MRFRGLIEGTTFGAKRGASLAQVDIGFL